MSLMRPLRTDRSREFVIPDDSGLIAIYDPQRYDPFLGANWTLEEILGRFRDSAVAQSLLVWATGAEGNWRVSIHQAPVAVTGTREVVGSIEASNHQLFVTSYDSLTMAAQFEEETL